jgi:flagellar hook-length control protein FliK
MVIQATTSPAASPTGAGGTTAGSGKASAASGSANTGFASVLGAQQNIGADTASADSAPDAQTASILGLLQILQAMIMPMQTPSVTNAGSNEQQGVQALPELLLKAMNGNPAFAQELLQNPNVQKWLEQASAVLQALGQPNASVSSFNLRSGIADQTKLTAQETLLQLATLAAKQPDNPIVQHVLNDLQRTVGPLITDVQQKIEPAQSDMPQIVQPSLTDLRSGLKPMHAANALQSGDRILVQQVVAETAGDTNLQQTKANLEMLAAKTSGVTANLQQQLAGDQGTDNDGSQSSSSDSSAYQTPLQPLQDLLKTLQQPNFDAKQAGQATIHAETFVRDMSEYMVKDMKLTLGDMVKEARLSLNPEHLGQIDVKITLHANGQLVAQLTADSTAGRQLLESQLPQLRQTLQNQGLQVERLEVAQQTDMASSMFQQRQGQGGGQQFARNNRTRTPEVEAVDGEFVNDLRTLADFRQAGSTGITADPSFDVTA